MGKVQKVRQVQDYFAGAILTVRSTLDFKTLTPGIANPQSARQMSGRVRSRSSQARPMSDDFFIKQTNNRLSSKEGQDIPVVNLRNKFILCKLGLY
jgi:hypothetical protein